jgi:hypothetical protein
MVDARTFEAWANWQLRKGKSRNDKIRWKKKNWNKYADFIKLIFKK